MKSLHFSVIAAFLLHTLICIKSPNTELLEKLYLYSIKKSQQFSRSHKCPKKREAKFQKLWFFVTGLLAKNKDLYF